MNVHQTLRKLRSEKRWYDDVITTLEHIERSRLHPAVPNGRSGHLEIDARNRRRLSQLLKAW